MPLVSQVYYPQRYGLTARKRAGHETWMIYGNGRLVIGGEYHAVLAYLHG